MNFHPSLLEALYPQLRSPRLAVRKRTILALGHLVVSCDAAIYAKIMDSLLEDLAKTEQAQQDSSALLNTRCVRSLASVIQRVFFIIFSHNSPISHCWSYRENRTPRGVVALSLLKDTICFEKVI